MTLKQINTSVLLFAILFLTNQFTLAQKLPDKTIALPDIENISTYAVTPDGSHVIIGTRTPIVWNLDTHEKVMEFTGHSLDLNWIEAIAVSPDGKLVASGDRKATVKVWDFKTGEELMTIRTYGYENPSFEMILHIKAIAFSPDGTLLATGETLSDMAFQVWSLKDGSELARKFRNQDPTVGIAETILLASNNSLIYQNVGTVFVFDPYTNNNPFELFAAKAATLAKDNRHLFYLAKGDQDEMAKVYKMDLQTREIVNKSIDLEFTTADVNILDEGKFVLLFEDNQHKLINTKTGNVVQKFERSGKNTLRDIPLKAVDNKVIGVMDNKIQIFDISNLTSHVPGPVEILNFEN